MCVKSFVSCQPLIGSFSCKQKISARLVCTPVHLKVLPIDVTSCSSVVVCFVCDVEIVDCALFNLQTVFVSCNVTIKMFFDNGCGDIMIKKVLVSLGRAKLIRPGPIDLAGVGDHKSTCLMAFTVFVFR